MDNKVIELLSEEIRETRKLTLAIEKETLEIRRLAEAAEKKADAAWELVVLTREESKRTFWRRMFG